ncbi:DUF6555 family protein [Pseudomonas sp. ICMP 561]|uniref:DUF6555 family protein n=1 Tax=Pseudomonas sp. ICMP 561 TaxID=1718918 RepID=UPI000C08C056|nr:DUF6555 family protein [Pseudomonas sp. ICMP 561]
MGQQKHYRIDYFLHGAFKSFHLCAPEMNSVEAWHWATIDAGLSQIPKLRNDNSPKLTKPAAERLGVSKVEWTLT